MCGRFTQHLTWTELVELYQLTAPVTPLNLPARYNVAPTQEVSVVRPTDGDGRELARMRWGLVPSWAKDIGIGAKLINARGETVASKPAFRSAFKRRRCLIPADGFYEWQAQASGPKQPFYITSADGVPLTLAGLWESWRDPDGEIIESCTIVTTEPNEMMRPLHNRMPVILAPEAHDEWMDVERIQGADALALIWPHPAAGMTAYPVSSRVGNVRNDDAGCVAPLAA